MKNVFPKDIMDCMHDTILAIFWPKEQIIAFFQDNGCTSRDIKPIQNYKELQLHRSQMVDMLFKSLALRDDGGLGQFRAILRSLTQWSHFDPYYFEKLGKLDKNIAIRLIAHLTQLQEIRDANLKQLKVTRLQKETSISQNTKTMSQLKDIFFNLYNGKDETGKSISSQKRGYLFEQFLREVCIFEKLSVTDPFKLEGEQIDGAIKYDGENYIIEAKWHDYLVASDALYHFAYKVEGKMYGRGIFFSLNGFSHDSLNALTCGKALRTVLFDGGDLTLIMEGLWTLTDMLDRKVKAAQTLGLIYVDVNNMKEKKGQIQN